MRGLRRSTQRARNKGKIAQGAAIQMNHFLLNDRPIAAEAANIHDRRRSARHLAAFMLLFSMHALKPKSLL